MVYAQRLPVHRRLVAKPERPRFHHEAAAIRRAVRVPNAEGFAPPLTTAAARDAFPAAPKLPRDGLEGSRARLPDRAGLLPIDICAPPRLIHFVRFHRASPFRLIE
jgi:hypothetical protein